MPTKILILRKMYVYKLCERTERTTCLHFHILKLLDLFLSILNVPTELRKIITGGGGGGNIIAPPPPLWLR